MNIIEVFRRFPTQESCLEYMEQVRWEGEPNCPYCGAVHTTALPKERRHHCNTCNTSFSVTVGTIFHKTRLPLQKWFLAISLVLNAKKGISARQLGRDLEINKDTAWRISMKIREAMKEKGQRELMTGIVEMDEAYVGGKPRRGYPDSPNAPRGRGTKKIPVVGMIERGGRVKAKVVQKKDLNAKHLSALVRRNVDSSNAVLITDEYGGYVGIKRFMHHEVVNHRIWYVSGFRHTNNIESFWAILKRGIIGQYHRVTLQHLPEYINEFTYRFNHRHDADL
ncbi:MAG: IS1595 family transposase [Candidatus Hydrogenedentes bacterium]|nr:IS1595 family transposase [Candidatus Hydrogenedentota bacterium]